LDVSQRRVCSFQSIVQSYTNSQRCRTKADAYQIVELIFWGVSESRSVLESGEMTLFEILSQEAIEGFLDGWGWAV